VLKHIFELKNKFYNNNIFIEEIILSFITIYSKMYIIKHKLVNLIPQLKITNFIFRVIHIIIVIYKDKLKSGIHISGFIYSIFFTRTQNICHHK